MSKLALAAFVFVGLLWALPSASANKPAVSNQVASVPINPRFFGFSSYLGPIVNLSYSDPAVLRVAAALRIGSLRYPGGSTANAWNISTGRWVAGMGSEYSNRTNGLPAGTYTPKAYMEGIGSTLRASPIWNLNLVTDSDPARQIDVLKSMGVPVDMVELSNEKADEPVAPYLERAAPLVARTREVFPNATVSVIGCFGVPWQGCAAQLKTAHDARPRLFDAITIHQYAPTNASIIAHASTDGERRCATLAAIKPSLSAMEARVSADIGEDVPIWLDEFNWGGDWAGVTWPGEGHGALRGLVWATYVLSAIEVTAAAQLAGRSGFAALDYYSLFFQDDNDWSRWASCASVSNQANQPFAVKFDGVSQIIAHVNAVAFAYGHTDVTVLSGVSSETVPAQFVNGQNQSCTLGAAFSGGPNGTTLVVVNLCDQPVEATLPSPISTHMFYSGFENTDWMAADNIVSVETPPWSGPLTVHKSSSHFTGATVLPPVSLSILH